MTKLEKWEPIINNILESSNHLFHQWVQSFQTSSVTTYAQLVEFTETYHQLSEDYFAHSTDFPEVKRSTLEAVKYLWDTHRRFYFKNYFVDEILKDPKHTLNNFFKELTSGIQSYTHYLALEEEWNRQVIPFYSGLRDDFSNLAKLALLKVYTAQKNEYYNNVLPVEIKEDKRNPFYLFTSFVSERDTLTNSDLELFDRLLVEAEQLIQKQNDQFRKRLFATLKPYFSKAKAMSFPQGNVKDAHWLSFTIDVKHHPAWVKTNQILTQFEEAEVGELTSQDLTSLTRVVESTKLQREREMGYFEFQWSQREFEKRLRLLEKRLQLQGRNLFGSWLREMRKSRGLSLKDLNKLSGVSSSYLHRLELGARQAPSIPIAEKIVKAFGASMNDVIKFLDSSQTAQIVEPVAEDPDILKWIALHDVCIGDMKLSKRKQTYLAELIGLIKDKNWNPDHVSKNLEMVDLIKKIRKAN